MQIFVLFENERLLGHVPAVGTGHYYEFTGFVDKVEVFVEELECFRSYNEIDCLAFAGLEGDALEAFELLNGA